MGCLACLWIQVCSRTGLLGYKGVGGGCHNLNRPVNAIYYKKVSQSIAVRTYTMQRWARHVSQRLRQQHQIMEGWLCGCVQAECASLAIS